MAASTPTIAVAAGKGGTGKTLVATSLAVAVHAYADCPVELLDCDVEEPNAHLLLRPHLFHHEPVTILVPRVEEALCTHCGRCGEVCQFHALAVIREAVITFPELCAGCGSCAFACPTGAIVEMPREVGVVSRGHTEEGIAFCQGRVKVGEQRSSPVTRAVKRHVHADRVTIIDAPPGTACPMQEAVQGADYCVLVTEPTPFGVNDLQLAVETCRQLAVPCGVIINRDGIGDSTPVEDYCRAENLRLLLRILHERRIAQAYARGLTLAHAFPEWRAPLCQVFEQIVVSLSANPQSTGDNADATR